MVRWVEHLSSEKTWSHPEKIKLLLDTNTEFKTLCLVNNYGRGTVFLATERYYSELYENLGYKVINQFSKKFGSWNGVDYHVSSFLAKTIYEQVAPIL